MVMKLGITVSMSIMRVVRAVSRAIKGIGSENVSRRRERKELAVQSSAYGGGTELVCTLAPVGFTMVCFEKIKGQGLLPIYR